MLYNNRFLPIDVQHCAESVDMKKYMIENDDFLLIIYSETFYDLNSIIEKMIHIIYIMKFIGKKINNNAKPNITILLGTQKKQINNYDIILSPININSGSSVGEINVMIWRKEEILKVMIHELIHFFNIDFYVYDEGYKELNEYLCNKYNVEHIDCPNESYTECLAVLINSCFTSYYTNISIKQILLYEILFTFFQISKILNFYNIKSFGELELESENKKIIQTTSVFSYFIVKGSLLFNLKKVIEFIKDDINNIVIKNDVIIFSDLVKSTLNEKYFIKINFMIKLFEYIKSIREHDFIMKTMRMTCFQI
jgi:hypothetical protein